MEVKMLEAQRDCLLYQKRHDEMEIALKKAEQTSTACKTHLSANASELRMKYSSIEVAVSRLVAECDNRVKAEKKNFEFRLQSLIIQHNAQLTEVKKQHKQVLAKLPTYSSISNFEETTSRDDSLPVKAPVGKLIDEERDSRSRRMYEEKERRVSSAPTLTVIAPKRQVVLESKEVKAIDEIKQISSMDRLASSSSLESITTDVSTGITAAEEQMEQYNFDKLWQSSLEEIQQMFDTAFVHTTSVPWADNLGHDSSGNARMKYVLEFQKDLL
jgi:hypothetical protein